MSSEDLIKKSEVQERYEKLLVKEKTLIRQLDQTEFTLTKLTTSKQMLLIQLNGVQGAKRELQDILGIKDGLPLEPQAKPPPKTQTEEVTHP